MNSFPKLTKLTGLAVFLISFVVYYFSVERTGSLWDCGEFILGAFKLQVVHPPGAPLFMIIGRLFAGLGDAVSSNPSDIAFAVNLMSALCSSLVAVFVAWTTMIFGKILLVGRENPLQQGHNILLGGAGLAAGLATAFCSSVWFSAVEGEVYAMSTFFTALSFWAAAKWYYLPNERKYDRWLVLVAFLAGLSIGVHLLSLLTFPAIALLYYFKKYEAHSLKGIIISLLAGVLIIAFVQKIIIVGIPTLWYNFELFLVNSFGLPVHSGVILTLLAIGAILYYLIKYAHKKSYHLLQLAAVSTLMVTIGFSVFGVIVLRANADTPINMNVPSDATRVLPYLNREQYGERPLLRGPHFDASPSDLSRTKRYGLVEGKYEYVEEKYDYVYNAKDKMFLPRIGHTDSGRPQLHRIWYNYLMGKNYRDGSNPGQGYNMKFFFVYQLNWMYWRYFMWNFAGRQNGEQGYYPWDKTAGHWISGIKPIDEARLYNMDQLPESVKKHKATNKYYFIPLILGLIGLFFHARYRQKEFLVLLTLFLLTGIGIIFYSNQPPNEPRERDYVLVGSFFTFCMWIGLGALALFKIIQDRIKLNAIPSAAIASVIVLMAPLIMGFQNFDDHSRMHHYASRDYASNFLESCEPNAIIFTYGDNDTYPLWYAQEVEGIRTDVRVVNLSLIAVDWYINKLRAKVNDSPPLNLTIPADAYRGKKRNQVPFYTQNPNQVMDLKSAIRYIGEQHPIQGSGMSFESFIPARNFIIPTDSLKAVRNGMIYESDLGNVVDYIELKFPNKNFLTKDDLAVLDIIASNIYDRHIYFASTCKNEKLLGLNDYMSYEGLGFQLVPIKTASDKTLSIYGSGRVDVERVYRNVMERFLWGNFDKKELFVDNSYAAEIQAHKLVIMRACEALSSMEDHERAVKLTDKYFEVFPHFNFPYDAGIFPFIEVYIQAGAFEQAKTHMRILGTEVLDQLQFYDSIDEDVLESSFETDYLYALKAVRDLLQSSRRVEDPAFANEMQTLVGAYDISNLKR